MQVSNRAVRTAQGALLLDIDRMSPQELRDYITSPVTDLLHPGRVFKAATDDDRVWFRDRCMTYDLVGEWASLAARFTCVTRPEGSRRLLRSLAVIASKPMPFLSFKVLHRTEVFVYVGDDAIESADEFYIRTGMSVTEVIRSAASSIQQACKDALAFMQAEVAYKEYIITDGQVTQTVSCPVLAGGDPHHTVVPTGWWVLGQA